MRQLVPLEGDEKSSAAAPSWPGYQPPPRGRSSARTGASAAPHARPATGRSDRMNSCATRLTATWPRRGFANASASVGKGSSRQQRPASPRSARLQLSLGAAHVLQRELAQAGRCRPPRNLVPEVEREQARDRGDARATPLPASPGRNEIAAAVVAARWKTDHLRSATHLEQLRAGRRKPGVKPDSTCRVRQAWQHAACRVARSGVCPGCRPGFAHIRRGITRIRRSARTAPSRQWSPAHGPCLAPPCPACDARRRPAAPSEGRRSSPPRTRRHLLAEARAVPSGCATAPSSGRARRSRGSS